MCVCICVCILHPYIFIYSRRQLYYCLYVTDEETESQHNYSRSCLTYSKLHLERLVSKIWILLKSSPMQTNYLWGWYKCIFLSPIPRNFNSVGLVWGLEICISKFFRWRLSMDHTWSSTDRCCIISFYILNTKCDLGIKSHPIYLIFSLLSTSPVWKTDKNQEVVKK